TAAGFSSADTAQTAEAPWPCAAFWGALPSSTKISYPDPTKPHSIVLVTGDTPCTAALQSTLHDAGHRVALARYADLFAEGAADVPGLGDASPEIMLFLAGECGTGDPVEDASRQITALARLAATAAECRAALWVVTCDAQQTALSHEPVGHVDG